MVVWASGGQQLAAFTSYLLLLLYVCFSSSEKFLSIFGKFERLNLVDVVESWDKKTKSAHQ